MPQTKLNLDNVYPVYDYQAGHYTESVDGQNMHQWLQDHFISALNLFNGHSDRLNYELQRRRTPNEGEVLEPRALSKREKTVLVNLSKESMMEVRPILSGRGYSYRNSSDWLVRDEHGTETGEINPCVYPLEIKHIKTLVNPEDQSELKVYSQYGESTLRYFGSAVDLTETSLPMTVSLMKHIRARQSDYARTNRFMNYCTSSIKIDTVGSFSCFGDKLSKETFIQKAGTDNIKVIKLESLYRGGGGKVTMSLSEVRAQKIVKGGFIFPYLWKTQILNQETLEYENIIMFCLGIFDDLPKIIKYKRSRDYIPRLLKDIEKMGGLKLFNPKEYDKIVAERWGEHALYWEGLSELFEDLPEDADVRHRNWESHVEAKDLIFLQRAHDISASEESTSFTNVKDAYEDIKLKVKTLTQDKNNADSNHSYYLDRVEQQRARLERDQESLNKCIKDKERFENEIEGFTTANKALETEFKSAEERYNKYIKEIQEQEVTTDTAAGIIQFMAGLKETGIVMTGMTYKDYKTQEVFEISDKPEIAFFAKQHETFKDNGYEAKRYQLESLNFTTLKPIVIRVDAGKDKDNCKKIVGGPYNVEVTRNAIGIKIASTSACFGYQPSTDKRTSSIWVHPHTQSYSVSLTNGWNDFATYLLERKANGCLGEAGPSLHKAFENQDPKQVVFAAMTWITNANSADTWGKNWKHFPRLDDVSLTGEKKVYVEDEADETTEIVPDTLVTSEEGMDQLSELASELIANLATMPEPEPIVMIEPVAPETTRATIERLPPEPAGPRPVPEPRYRVVGVEGYQPLSALRAGRVNNPTTEEANNTPDALPAPEDDDYREVPEEDFNIVQEIEDVNHSGAVSEIWNSYDFDHYTGEDHEETPEENLTIADPLDEELIALESNYEERPEESFTFDSEGLLDNNLIN